MHETRPLRLVLLQDRAAPAPAGLDIAGEYEALLAAAAPDFAFADFDENTRATLFYTTGTTGDPHQPRFEGLPPKRLDATPGSRFRMSIASTWDGRDARPEERVEVELGVEATELALSIDAPYHGDPPPRSPERDAAAGSSEPESFPEVLAWQRVLLNSRQRCAATGRELEPGEEAYVGIGEQGLTGRYLSREAMEQRGVTD